MTYLVFFLGFFATAAIIWTTIILYEFSDEKPHYAVIAVMIMLLLSFLVAVLVLETAIYHGWVRREVEQWRAIIQVALTI